MAEFQARLLKHAWKVLLLVVLGVGAGYGLLQIPPAAIRQLPTPLDRFPAPSAYESTATIFLNAAEPGDTIPYVRTAMQMQNLTPGIATLASTYTAYLKSDTFARRLIDRLQLPVAPDVIQRAIATRLLPETNVLNIAVRWDTPATSQQIANTVAEMLTSGGGPGGPTSVLSAKLNGQADYNEQQIAQLQGEIERTQNDTALTEDQRSGKAIALRQQLQTVSDTYSRILGAQVTSQAISPDRTTPGAIFDSAQEGQQSPKPWLIMLFGGIAGLAIGVGLIALLEYVDPTIDVTGELQDVLAAPVLGAFGSLHHLPSWRRGASGRGPGVLSKMLVTATRPGGRPAEAFRLLRARIEATPERGGALRSVLITSARRGEGRTLVAANLAIAIAQTGRQVILVDADLRHPNLHRLFGLPNTSGLTDLLSWSSDRTPGDSNPEPTELIHSIPSIPNLRVLPSGSTPEMETQSLSATVACDVIALLSGVADIVIVDAAPAPLMADTLALASQVDGVIAVARARQTRRDAVEELGESIAQVHGRLIGTVLNGGTGSAGVTRAKRGLVLFANPAEPMGTTESA